MKTVELMWRDVERARDAERFAAERGVGGARLAKYIAATDRAWARYDRASKANGESWVQFCRKMEHN